WRCASLGCQQSWASRQAQRLLAHAVEECRFIAPDLRERAAQSADELSLGKKVEKLDAIQQSSHGGSTKSTCQPSVAPVVSTEGRKAAQIRFDFNLVNFRSAAQLAPSKIDIPEFHTLVSHANLNLRPKHSTYIGSGQIPMESARVRRLFAKELKRHQNLTISFDGGTAICPKSFTTIHVTTPDTRDAYLMEAIEASGVSHTGKCYFGELEKVITEIGPLSFSGITCDSTGNTRLARELIHTKHPTIIMFPDPCHQLHNAVKDIGSMIYFSECKTQTQKISRFFNKSTIAATHLNATRGRMGIKESMKRPGKTRFAGWHYAANGMRRCLPAVEHIVKDDIIEVKKVSLFLQLLRLYLTEPSCGRNVNAYAKFKTEIEQLEKVTEPFAKAIKGLESGYSTPCDVFIFNLAIMASLRELSDNNDTGLSLPESVLTDIQNAASNRYFNMVLASGNEIYVTAFFLHPQYVNSDILRRNNTNPLSSGIVMRPRSLGDLPNDDEDIWRAVPSFGKIGLYLKTLLCRELTAGTIPAAKDYPNVDSIITVFKTQLAAYARGVYPFVLPSTIPIDFSPLKHWKKLAKHPDATFLGPLAVKIYSVVPNSMAEERTVSCFTKLNSKDRSAQKISTLVHMTRIRQHLMRNRGASKPVCIST
ncbi:hypothetical protein BDV93DRAFT_460199, partial [Ceratobasidium sp. AG-I]